MKWPFRWTPTTWSNSSSLMLNSIRSRTMPATQTTPSMVPQFWTAVSTMRCPTAISDTSPATAMAVPPAARISSTTTSATSLDGSLPSMVTP